MRHLARMLLVIVATGAAVAAVAPAAQGATNEELEVLLTLERPGGLDRFVQRVSDPASPRYRHYLPVSKLIDRYGASKRTQRAALRWLERRGAPHAEVGPTAGWIRATLPADSTARKSIGLSRGVTTASSRALPPSLRGEVESVAILGTTPGVFKHATERALPPPEIGGSMLPRTGTPRGCEAGRNAGFEAPYSAFTPNQYLSAYGHSRLHRRGVTGRGVRVAVVEIDGFRRSDVAEFTRCFGLPMPKLSTHTVGIPKPLPPGDETTLDLEVLSAAAPGLERIDIYEGTSSEVGIFESVAGALGKAGKRPDVISISLEGCEADLTSQREFQRGLDHVFAVAAGAGISTFVAAGDQGSSACSRKKINALPLLAVSVPASSNYVTAVGGTNIRLTADNQLSDQIVWNDVPSTFGGGGGGISLLSGRPFYQRGLGGDVSVGNARTLPDVSGLADVLPGYAIYCTADPCLNGDTSHWIAIGGTSAATPLLAGGVALADQRAADAGQRRLGLVNPLFYELGTGKGASRVFFDVTTGSNDLGTMIPAEAGGGEPLGCCSASRGYDLASGLGSPYLNRLSAAALDAGRR